MYKFMPYKGSWPLYYNITNILETSMKYLWNFIEVSEIDHYESIIAYPSFGQFYS